MTILWEEKSAKLKKSDHLSIESSSSSENLDSFSSFLSRCFVRFSGSSIGLPLLHYCPYSYDGIIEKICEKAIKIPALNCVHQDVKFFQFFPANCKKLLDSGSITEHDGEMFCNACYRKHFGPKGYGFGGGAGCLSMDDGKGYTVNKQIA